MSKSKSKKDDFFCIFLLLFQLSQKLSQVKKNELKL